MQNLQKITKKILDLDTKKKIAFIVLFGSQALGKAHKTSDIDLAVFYHGTKKERFAFRVHALGELQEHIDLQIFQDLPLAIRKEVLGGKVLYSHDFTFTFTIFLNTIKDYNSFKKYLHSYYNALEDEAYGLSATGAA